MQSTRRSFLGAAAATAAASYIPVTTAADVWPAKPVRLISPHPPGSATDIWAREVATHLGGAFSQPILVENKTGASAQIGTDYVAKATDGHTFLIATPPNAIQATLYRKLPYDIHKDFQPVALLARYPLVLITSGTLGANSVQELAALAKSGKLSYASAGSGSSSHLSGEMFRLAVGAEMAHIPYRGNTAAHTDLIAGRVAVLFDNVMEGEPAYRGGAKALAVASSQRSPAIPEAPTTAEAGIPTVQASSWTSVLASKSVPSEGIERMNAEINRMLQKSDLRARYVPRGVEIGGGTPARMATFLAEEIKRWGDVIKAANVPLEG